MNDSSMIQDAAQVASQTVALDTDAEARKEREAVRWCEALGRKLNAKKSGYRPNKRRGQYESSRR